MNSEVTDTYTSEETRKEHKAEESTTTEANDESTDDEKTQSKAFVTYVNNIMHSVFSNVKVYIINHQRCNFNEL